MLTTAIQILQSWVLTSWFITISHFHLCTIVNCTGLHSSLAEVAFSLLYMQARKVIGNKIQVYYKSCNEVQHSLTKYISYKLASYNTHLPPCSVGTLRHIVFVELAVRRDLEISKHFHP